MMKTDENNCGIYRIHAPNGSYYLGSSREIKRRWAEHKLGLKRKCHPNRLLQHLHDVYGEKLMYEIVENVPPELLIEREQELLKLHYGQSQCVNMSGKAGAGPYSTPWKGKKMPREATAARIRSYQATCATRAIKAGWSKSYLYKLRRTDRARYEEITRQPLPGVVR